MAYAMVKGRVIEEQLPEAPLEDEAEVQHLMDELFAHVLKTPNAETQTEILLGTVRDGRLKVHSPIIVKFKYENEQVIAEAEEIDEFGFGNNPAEALADLQRAIAELYFTLEKEKDRLGVDLQRVWNILQEKILKR